MHKSGLVILISILFSSYALAQSTPDWSFNGEIDSIRDTAFCKGAVSLTGRNIAVLDKDIMSSDLKLSVHDRTYGNSYTVNNSEFQFTSDKVFFEVSDFGPIGEGVNLIYAVHQTPPVINFSKDSGETFIQLSLPTDVNFSHLTDQSLGYDHGPHSIKFGPDGNLYAIYWSSAGDGVGPVVVNLAIWDKDGNNIYHKFDFAQNDLLSTFGASTDFISITFTHNNLVAVFLPGRPWNDFGMSADPTIPDSLVFDLSSQTITDQVHIGAYTSDPPEEQYYNNPYEYNPTTQGQTNIIASDGASVYYAAQSGPETNANGQTVYVVEFRRFNEYSTGKFFPDDYQTPPGLPMTHLPSRPTNARSIDFMTKTTSGGQGEFAGFAAPRFSSNYTNEVSVLYLPPDPDSGDLTDHYKISFNPDTGTVGVPWTIVEDVTFNSLTELFGESPFIFKGAFIGNHQSGGLSSTNGGTISHFCTHFGTPEDPATTFWGKYWSAMS